jgi:hypothetical protein
MSGNKYQTSATDLKFCPVESCGGTYEINSIFGIFQLFYMKSLYFKLKT